MGIWVRSQKKDILISCESIEVDKKTIYGNEYLLGEYATEERAMQVLNNLQGCLMKGTERDIVEGNKRVKSNFVFNMPER